MRTAEAAVRELRDLLKEVGRDRPGEATELAGDTGVLLSDKIRLLIKKHNMIWPASEDDQKHCLKPAMWNLRVGSTYWHKGEPIKLDPTGKDGLQYVEIPPYGVVHIETHEILMLPTNIIARWNLRVNLVNQGLMWAGAQQVDPGWAGRLVPPIYNLTDKVVRIPAGSRFATMDFVVTTSSADLDEKELYPFPKTGNLTFMDGDTYRPLVSGLAELQQSLLNYEEKFSKTLGAWEDYRKETREELDRRTAAMAEKLVEARQNLKEVEGGIQQRVTRVEQASAALTGVTLAILTILSTAVIAVVGSSTGLIGAVGKDGRAVLSLGHIGAILAIVLMALLVFFAVYLTVLRSVMRGPES